MDFGAERSLEKGWRRGGEGRKKGCPAEGAMAAYFASRKQVRILHSDSLSGASTRLSPQGAGRIQSLRAFRRAMELKKSNLDKDRRIEFENILKIY